MWKIRIRDLSEQRLIAAAVGGDREAGERLVRLHYASVFAFMMALCRDRDSAEELVQSTFVSCWQSLAGFRGDSSLRTWIHQIAYRQYLHRHRRPTNHTTLEYADEAAESLEPGLVDSLWLEHAISALPEALAAPFVLHYVQQMPVNDIAAVLEIKRGTVLSRLHTARQRMRTLLAAHERNELHETPEEELPERSCYEMSKASI